MIIKLQFYEVVLIIVYCYTKSVVSYESPLKGGILYPRESETREVKLLDGIWNFRLSQKDTGFEERWFAKNLNQTGPVISMPVPSSYNDVTMDAKIRNHVGWVWYERKFFAPISWKRSNFRIWLRFGSVHYRAQVIGHLPFHSDITSFLNFDVQDRVTVAVDNTLLFNTLPQGSVKSISTDYGVKKVQAYDFDFFNYAGIHRSVHLYTTPTVYVDDISVNTEVEDHEKTGIVYYEIFIAGRNTTNVLYACEVSLVDKEGNFVVENIHNSNENSFSGSVNISNVKLWWPYLMHSTPVLNVYVSVLFHRNLFKHNENQIRLKDVSLNIIDVYSQPVGFRTLKWNQMKMTVNGKRLYLRGFGRHEDSDIRGKGFDFPLVAKDYNLIQWIGANSYRTSHYPYAEEIMDMADQLGIMIINECPAVNLENFSLKMRKKHEQILAELIQRDKNRPSVIMWSIANEPSSQLKNAGSYFKVIAEAVRNLDKLRPVVAVLSSRYHNDKMASHLDIIGFNRYNSWYFNSGQLDTIQKSVETEAHNWFAKYKKPVFMAEYGAETISGFHSDSPVMGSEEYQEKLLSEHFKVFDRLRKSHFFYWRNDLEFADFNTGPSICRLRGNKKGVFTRRREPKTSAYLLRQRYWLLAQDLENLSLPDDLRYYSAKNMSRLP